MPAEKNFSNKSKNEYEVIEHRIIKNFKVFLVSLAYRTPHIHSDFECSFLLKGSALVICDGVEKTFMHRIFLW